MIWQLYNAGFHLPTQISLTTRRKNPNQLILSSFKVISWALTKNSCLHANVKNVTQATRVAWEVGRSILYIVYNIIYVYMIHNYLWYIHRIHTAITLFLQRQDYLHRNIPVCKSQTSSKHFSTGRKILGLEVSKKLPHVWNGLQKATFSFL